MIVIQTKKDFMQWRAEQTQSIGFAPTMGNLHLGHISLMEKALQDNDIAVMSIYVNPTQFGPNDDFNRYPRTLQNDLALLENLEKKYPHKKIVAFTPSTKEEVYGENSSSFITVEKFDHILEGEKRPGHFRGVATVVYLLLKIVQPHQAYFGQKDYQQVLVIQEMVKDLLLSTQIIMMPILRDSDGLALSSRNQYLSTEQRNRALILPQTLDRLAAEIKKNGRGAWLEERINSIINQDADWDYLLAKNAFTLQAIDEDTTSIVLLAVYRQGTTRLLDNQVVTLL